MIKSFTQFEMPYRLEISQLYERQKPKGFSEDLKAFAIKKICSGFDEKSSLSEVSDFVLDSMRKNVGGNWLCLIVPSKALNGISLHCDHMHLKLGFTRGRI